MTSSRNTTNILNNVNIKIDDETNNKINNEINNEISNFDIRSFNDRYEMYQGTTHKFHISNLLDEIVTNNKINKDRTINVIYKETNTTIEDINK